MKKLVSLLSLNLTWQRSVLLGLGIIAVLAVQTTAFAQTLTPTNPAAPKTRDSVGPGTMTGSDGYLFFNAQAPPYNGTVTEPTLLPSYVDSISNDGDPEYGNGADSQITINPAGGPPGALTYTGFDYVGGAGNLATIVLKGSVPTSFYLGILVDNNYFHGANLNTLTLYSGDPSLMGTTVLDAQAFNATALGDTGVNHFYFMDVADASAGDYLVVSAVTNYVDGDPFLTLGGVTFNTTSRLGWPQVNTRFELRQPIATQAAKRLGHACAFIDVRVAVAKTFS